jgi:hypothetical protein
LSSGIYNDFSNFPPCTYASEEAVYKLSGLKSDTYSPTVGKGKILYGLCRNTQVAKPKECNGKPNSQSYYVEGGVCYAFNVAGKIKTLAVNMAGGQPIEGVKL